MPDIEISNEDEVQGGWSYRLRFTGDDGRPSSRLLRLSWADYDLWSAEGADPPHAVAEAVARFLLSRLSASDLPPSMDASLARRKFSDADAVIPTLIR